MNEPWTDIMQPDATNLVVTVTITPSMSIAADQTQPSISLITLTESFSTPQASRSVCSTIFATATNGSVLPSATKCSDVPENAPTKGAVLGVALSLGTLLLGSAIVITYKWWRSRKHDCYSKLGSGDEKALDDPGAKQLLSLASPTQPPPPPTERKMSLASDQHSSIPMQQRASLDTGIGKQSLESIGRRAPYQAYSPPKSNRQPSGTGRPPIRPFGIPPPLLTKLNPASEPPSATEHPTQLKLDPFPGRLTLNLSDRSSMPPVQTLPKYAQSQSTNGTASYHGSIHSVTTRASSRTSSPFPSSTYKAYSPAVSKRSSPESEFSKAITERRSSQATLHRSPSSPHPGSRVTMYTPFPVPRPMAPSVPQAPLPVREFPLEMHKTKSNPSATPVRSSIYPGMQFVPYSAIKRAKPLSLNPVEAQNSDTMSGFSGPAAREASGRRGAVIE